MKKLVQWNGGGQLHIQLEGPKRDPAAKDQTVALGEVLYLSPGNNPVDGDKWVAAKRNPIVQALMREVIQPSAAPEQDPRVVGRLKLIEVADMSDENPLGKLKPVQALKVVEETLDTAVLEKWLEIENREDVRKAITKQIAEVNAPYIAKGQASPATTRNEPAAE